MCPPPTTAPADSLSDGARATLVDCRAGARPKMIPVSTETASAKPRMRASGDAESGSGASPAGINRRSSRSHQTATASPAAPPSMASNRLSTISCSVSRSRPAPSASLTAISFWRLVARAINKLATLAHAISSTKPTIAISTTNGVCACLRSPDRPCDPGITSMVERRNCCLV